MFWLVMLLRKVEGKDGGEFECELDVKGIFPPSRIAEDDDGEDEGVEVDMCVEMVVDKDMSIPIERGIAESRGFGCS